MRLLRRLRAHGHARTFAAGLHRVPGVRLAIRDGTEPAGARLDHRLVGDVPRHRQDHIRGHVLRAEVALDRRKRQRARRLRGAADVASEGLVGPERFVGEDGGQFARAVLHHGQLLEDDHALLLELDRVHLRGRHHVREDVDRLQGGPVGRLRVVDGQLAVGGGVVEPAHAFDRLGDLLRGRPARGALEEHVLEEVREARFRVGLVAAARAHVHADRGGSRLRHLARDDPQPVGQHRSFKHLGNLPRQLAGGANHGRRAC